MLRSSSVVEQSAVNRLAVGSNPTCGATTLPHDSRRLSGYPFQMLKEFGHLFQDAIRSEAECKFGLRRSASVPLDGSHSYVFDYPGDSSPIILTIIHSSHRSVQKILGELDFTNYLADNGMNVSRAIPSLGGQWVETMGAESGHFLATAYEKAPSALVDWREWTPELFEQWGALIGRMHALTKSTAPPTSPYAAGIGTRTETGASNPASLNRR